MAESQALVRARRVIERLVGYIEEHGTGDKMATVHVGYARQFLADPTASMVNIEAAFDNYERAAAQTVEADTALAKANRESDATFGLLCTLAGSEPEAEQ